MVWRGAVHVAGVKAPQSRAGTGPLSWSMHARSGADPHVSRRRPSRRPGATDRRIDGGRQATVDTPVYPRRRHPASPLETPLRSRWAGTALRPFLQYEARCCPASVGSGCPVSVELERQPERVVDHGQCLVAGPAHERSEPLGGDGRGLLDQHLCLFVSDDDRGAEDARWRRTRCGRHEHGRQHQVVGLDDDDESCPSLLASASVTRCSEAVDVTTHEARPSRRRGG